MKVKIYVEGGGDNSDTITRCKRGFAEYCKKLSPPTHLPAIIACGGRKQAFDRFRTAVENRKAGERYALLVDSEGPVAANATPVTYLGSHEGWNFVDLPENQVFLMVQAMEAWLLADRGTLAAFYQNGFRPNALRGDEHNVEVIPKNDLEKCLIDASRASKTKGPYHKTRHAFDLLAEIDPQKVESSSPHAAAFHKFLRSM